jgi:ABC-type nitrate/sulfonate/bicarbonate transport system permease component
MRRLGLAPPEGLLPLLVLLAAWQAVGTPRSPYFPPPLEWGRAIAGLIAGGRLWSALGATIEAMLAALLAAAALGVLLGVAIGLSPVLARATGPLLEFLRALPPPVLVPVAVLLLGYAALLKVFVVGLAALWPILLNVASGVAQIEPLLLDVSATLRLSRAARLRKIVLPSIVPALLLGLRTALPLAIVVTLLVEMLTLLPGIGSLIIRAQRDFQSAQVYGLLVVIGVFGFLMNGLFSVLERAVLSRWPPRLEGGG